MWFVEQDALLRIGRLHDQGLAPGEVEHAAADRGQDLHVRVRRALEPEETLSGPSARAVRNEPPGGVTGPPGGGPAILPQGG